MAQGYLIFHLNLAFSSIKTESRPEVISKCYWPLLELAKKTGIPIGIELTGWTLQQIALLDQSWVVRFRRMLAAHQCELIGSGWSQIIGPLVPYEVNHWNQKLGLDAYRQLLGVTPRIALVNEMAFSSGMVDIYEEAGYKGIIMDRDNVRLALGLDNAPLSATPTHALGCRERFLPVLWSDSILFQRLQRVVHGDIPVSEYMEYVQRRVTKDQALLPIYCNDAEIFDYRPGRFTVESKLHQEGEWERFQRICNRLKVEKIGLEWLSPSQALNINTVTSSPNIARLTSASHPVPVKKQAKYNITRWAVTGRDDLWLNTVCHQIHHSLMHNGYSSDENWRELCELWSSDLRTHITADRWKEALDRVINIQAGQNFNEQFPSAKIVNKDIWEDNVQIAQDDEGILWSIKTPKVHLVVNARRGLAIKSLSFISHNFEPLIGTLPQGYFNNIALGADFYSGGVIIEVPGEQSRVTDLEWVVPKIMHKDNELWISAKVRLIHGILEKTIAINVKSEKVRLTYNFEQFERPLGIVRVGIITFLPEYFLSPIRVSCVNGGKYAECFDLDQEVNHGQPASTLVSSSGAFGATDGRIVMEDNANHKLVFSWNPAECAAIPMLKYHQSQGCYLTRLSFSLCEFDETSHAYGKLLSFTFEVNGEKSLPI